MDCQCQHQCPGIWTQNGDQQEPEDVFGQAAREDKGQANHLVDDTPDEWKGASSASDTQWPRGRKVAGSSGNEQEGKES